VLLCGVSGFAHDDRILYKSVKSNSTCQRLISVYFPGISLTLNKSEERFEVSLLLGIILY